MRVLVKRDFFAKASCFASALDSNRGRFVNRGHERRVSAGQAPIYRRRSRPLKSRTHSSAGERSLHTGEVQGSIPCASTIKSMRPDRAKFEVALSANSREKNGHGPGQEGDFRKSVELRARGAFTETPVVVTCRTAHSIAERNEKPETFEGIAAKQKRCFQFTWVELHEAWIAREIADPISELSIRHQQHRERYTHPVFCRRL